MCAPSLVSESDISAKLYEAGLKNSNFGYLLAETMERRKRENIINGKWNLNCLGLRTEYCASFLKSIVL